jgi:sulfur dioxygenase
MTPQSAQPDVKLSLVLFRQLFDAASASYTYFVGDPVAREAVIIDTVMEQHDRDAQLIEELGLRLVYALETHLHADHITGASLMRERFGARLVATRTAGPACCDLAVGDGDIIRFARQEIAVLSTPGHTNGCLSYLVPGQCVFTGDALMIRTCGRTDFQGGDAGALWDSVNDKLFVLPDETLVYPAHDYRGFTVSTIGEEKRLNARLAGRSRADFIALMGSLDLAMPKRIHEALPANLACGKPQTGEGKHP